MTRLCLSTEFVSAYLFMKAPGPLLVFPRGTNESERERNSAEGEKESERDEFAGGKREREMPGNAREGSRAECGVVGGLSFPRLSLCFS